MMKALTYSILFLALTGAAQQITDRPAQPGFIFDDDGGAVQVVPANLTAQGEKTFHGGAVLRSVQQVSIFLGSGWADEKVRARETALLDLLANAQTPELQSRNIKTMPASPKQEDFSRLNSSRLNDLDIQHRLNDMLRNHALSAPGAGTVFVVFLSPEISSVIGGHQGGADFAAYHNFFHVEAGEVRYVVVPFNANAATQLQAATQALIETALNPHGDGWF
ncbi:MAG: hypothetical protein DMG65_19505 [Candidatus Angelobacter sp. Gp1-AA117]|nr:MAG: hypothetical protein DMG65_19505 [Candidatus Angelobacter sp. Gp1-AA117]